MARGVARLKVGDAVEVFASLFNVPGVAEKNTWSFRRYGAEHKSVKLRGTITRNLAKDKW